MAEVTTKQFLDLAGLTTYDVEIKKLIKANDASTLQLESRVDAIDSSIAKLEGADASLADDLSTLKKTVTDHITTVGDIVGKLAEHAASNDAKFAEIDSSIDRLDTSVDDLYSKLEKITDAPELIEGLDASVADHETRIETLETWKDTAAADITTIKAKDTAQDTSIKANADAIKALQDKTVEALKIGGVTYDGTAAVTANFNFTEGTGDDAGKLLLNCGGVKIADFDTAKFTKDAFLKNVAVDKETSELVFTFNLDSSAGGNNEVRVSLADMFSGKATDVKVTEAINTEFVNIAAGTNMQDAFEAMADAGSDLKTNLASEQAAQDTKIAGNTTRIETLEAEFAAIGAIPDASIKALFTTTGA